MRALVTGAAGFIGYHVSRRLLAEGYAVDGFDGMTPYYDVKLKQARWAELGALPAFSWPGRDAGGFRRAAGFADQARYRRASGGAGRGALQPGKPARLCRRQSGGPYNVLEVARGVRIC